MASNEKKMIGKNIKNRRNELNMKQVTLANDLHISPSLLAQYESGKRIPKYDRLQKIAYFLNVRPEDLDESLKPMAFDSSTAFENAWMQLGGGKHPGTISLEAQLQNVFPLLNDEGIKKVMEYAEDLRGNVKYRRD